MKKILVIQPIHEAGLELIRPPREPNCKPISSTISSRHPDWNHFLA